MNETLSLPQKPSEQVEDASRQLYILYILLLIQQIAQAAFGNICFRFSQGRTALEGFLAVYFTLFLLLKQGLVLHVDSQFLVSFCHPLLCYFLDV